MSSRPLFSDSTDAPQSATGDAAPAAVRERGDRGADITRERSGVDDLRLRGGSGRWTWGALLVILLIAAALRLPALSYAPPGLNQDEAANAWNAWCLLHTGRDQTGTAWPVFYTRALGANRSTLYIYLLLPFQALGGLNAWTTRLPSALGGVLTVALLYWIVRRMWSRPAGLCAAALLALNPWHIQLARLGHEAGIAPLLGLLPLAAWLWAGVPLGGEALRPRPGRALLAGLLTGVVCYGYPAVRIYVPLVLLACALVNLPALGRWLRSRGGLVAAGMLVIGTAVTFGPLAYQHLAHPEQIAWRAQHLTLWQSEDALTTRVGMVAERYAAHFGPQFMFVQGDPDEIYSARGTGAYHWYALPLLAVGVVVVLRQLRGRAAAWTVLVLLLLYPAGDCLHRHILVRTSGTAPETSLHFLRSAPGLTGPVVVAGIGTAAAFEALRRRQRRAVHGVAAAYGAVVLVFTLAFVTYYFGAHRQRFAVYHGYHVDLVEACRWLGPRLDEIDAAFITASDMNMPYVVTLVALGYDAQQWFRAEREVMKVDADEWEALTRVGRLHFLYGPRSYAAVDEYLQNERRERLIFIVRPGEARMTNPARVINDEAGSAKLVIYDTIM